MTDNTTLDAAIRDTGYPVRIIDRRFFQRVITMLLEGMEPEDGIHSTDGEIGWTAALTEIRRRAGIEGGES